MFASDEDPPRAGKTCERVAERGTMNPMKELELELSDDVCLPGDLV